MVPPLKASFRSSVKYGAAWGSELAGPALGWWARHKAPGPVMPPQAWRKGLLIGANHIGDILYRTCSLAALSRGLPDCQWDIIAPSPACEVLEGNPAIRKVHRFEWPSGPQAPGFDELRAEAYDVALCYDSGMYAKPLKLSVELGIPNRVAYVHKGFSALTTHPVPMAYPQPFASYFRDLVHHVAGVSVATLRPEVFPTEENRKAAEAWWQQNGLRPERPVLAAFMSTRQPTGIWPADRFAGVVKVWQEQGMGQAVLCGGPQDGEFLQALKTKHHLEAPVMAGNLNLRAMTHFLAKCRMVLCPDSGSRHLANAAGTRVFFFRNLRSSAIETGKYCDNETDLSPPGEFLLPPQQEKILEGITVETVVAKLAAALKD